MVQIKETAYISYFINTMYAVTSLKRDMEAKSINYFRDKYQQTRARITAM